MLLASYLRQSSTLGLISSQKVRASSLFDAQHTCVSKTAREQVQTVSTSSASSALLEHHQNGDLHTSTLPTCESVLQWIPGGEKGKKNKKKLLHIEVVSVWCTTATPRMVVPNGQLQRAPCTQSRVCCVYQTAAGLVSCLSLLTVGLF